MSSDKNPLVQINLDRLNFLLDLYGLSKKDFIEKINDNYPKLVTKITEESIFSSNPLKLSLLKKIDKVFNKGLTYYIDPSKPYKDKNTSIFFRKDKFGFELNFESKKVVNSFEEKKFDIEIMLDDTEMELNRILPFYKTENNVKEVAFELRERFDKIGKELIDNDKVKRPDSLTKYLKYLSAIMSELNIFVFEHIDHPRKKEKVNFNGFFMSPNMVVLNNQKYRKRQIFTLLHEFAHYLLNYEEIDEKTYDNNSLELGEVEEWCNEFAFYFLIKNELVSFENINFDNLTEALDEISEKTSLSVLALLTKLKKEEKISKEKYNESYSNYLDNIRRIEEKQKEDNSRKKEEAIELGLPQFVPPKKPIESNLFVEVVKQNYFEGKIDEVKICEILNKPFSKVEKILYKRERLLLIPIV